MAGGTRIVCLFVILTTSLEDSQDVETSSGFTSFLHTSRDCSMASIVQSNSYIRSRCYQSRDSKWFHEACEQGEVLRRVCNESCRACSNEHTKITACQPAEAGFFASSVCQTTWTAMSNSKFYVRKMFLRNANNSSESCSSTPISVLYQMEQGCFPDSSGYFAFYRTCGNQAVMMERCVDSSCSFCLDVFSKSMGMCELSGNHSFSHTNIVQGMTILSSHNISLAQMPCLGFVGAVLFPQPSIALSGNSSKISMGITDVAISLETLGNSSQSVLQGDLTPQTKCGFLSYTDLRIDKVGTYVLKVTLIFDPAVSTLNVIRLTSQIFHVSYGKPDSIVINRPARGLRIGYPFKLQPIVNVVDVGQNLVLNSDLEVTAICFPRDVCRLGSWLSNESVPRIYQDALRFRIAQGTYAFQSSNLGIHTADRSASIEFTSYPLLKTQMQMILGYNPYRINLIKNLPSPLYAGIPLQLLIQLSARYDEPFGWFDRRPAIVQVALFRIKFTTHTEAPFQGNRNATVDYDGIASNEVVLMEVDYVYYFRFSLVFNLDGVDISLPTVTTGTFNVLPGPAFAISPISFNAQQVLKSGLVMAPQPSFMLLDVYGNQNRSWPLPVEAYAEVLNQSALNPFREGDTLLFGNSRISFVSGVASFTDLSFNRIGTFRLFFTSQGLKGFNFTIQVTHGDPSSLLLFREPQGLLYSKEFDVSPIVHVVDTGNNLVDNQVFSISVELITNGTSFYFWLQPQRSWILPNLEYLPVVDNSDLTFYQPALFSTWNLFFDLGAPYHIRKLLMKYMLIANGLDITLTNVQILSNDGATPAVIATLSNSQDVMEQTSNVSALSIFDIAAGSPATRKVIVRVLGTSSGGAPRISGINFFAGTAPTLTAVRGNTLVRNTTMGRLDFSALMVAGDHRGFFDPQSIEGANVSTARACQMSLRFSVSSSVPAIRPVTSRWFQVSHGAVEVRFLSYSSRLAFNQTMNPPLSVQLHDQYGVVATSGSYPISAVLISQDQHQVMLVDTFVNVTVGGFASFSVRSQVAGVFTIKVTCGWIESEVGPLVVSHGVASRLLLVQEPQGWIAGFPLRSQPVLRVVDAANNTAADDSFSTILAYLYSNGYEISDFDFPFSTKAVQGIARFSNIEIQTAASNLVLAFGINSSKVWTFSQPIQIVKGKAEQLLLRRMVSRCIAKQKCIVQPIIHVSDSGGNKIETSGILTVTVLSSDNQDVTSDVLLGTQSFAFSAGSLELSDIAFSQNGTFALKFYAVELQLGLTTEFFQVTMEVAELQVLVQPSSFLLSGEAGRPLVQQPQLAMLDEAGKIVVSSSSLQAVVFENNVSQSVSRQISSSPDGIFRFTDLVVYRASSCVTIKFVSVSSSPLLSREVMSLPFEIRYGQSSRLQVLQQPERCKVGKVCEISPKVAVTDNFANLITSSDSTAVTASVISAERDSLVNLAADFTQSGLVYFSRLVLTMAGECLFLRFSSFPLAPADSDHFVVKPGAPSSLLLVREPADPLPGEPLGVQPGLALRDEYENLCIEAEANVTANTHHSSGDVAVKGSTTATFAGGYATFTDLQVDIAGSFLLNFTVGGSFSVASRLLSLSPSTAWNLDMLEQPDGIRSMLVLQKEPAVAVRDKGGNLVQLSGVPVTVVLRSNFLRLSTLNRTVLTESGVARFTDLVILGSERDVSFVFSTSKGSLDASWAYDEVVSVTSDFFDVAGPPHNLSVETNPEDKTKAGVPFSLQPVIRVIDLDNLTSSWCPFQVCSINASLTCDPPDICPKLQGTTQVIVKRGLAIFTDLSLLQTNNGKSFRMKFELNERIFAYSWPFIVLPADPTRISIQSIPSQNDILPGVSFRVQPRLIIVDMYDNLVPASTWMLCELLQAGSLQPQYQIYGHSNISVVDGNAQFTDLYCRTAGDRFSLSFSTPSLPSVQTDDFKVTAGSVPTSLSYLQAAHGFRSSAVFRVQPSVTSVDAGGNLVPVNEGTVTASLLLSQPSANVKLVGTLTVSLLKGIATFTDLAINSLSSVIRAQLLFSSGVYNAQLKSEYFNVSDMAGARSLTLVQLIPNENRANASFALQPMLASLDINDVIVDVESGIFVNVSISSSESCCGYIGYDFGNAKIYGKSSIQLERGFAAYTDLKIDKVGRHFLEFSCKLQDGTLAQTGQWIYILINQPLRIDLFQISSDASTGELLLTQPALLVVDAGGNRIRDQRQEASVATVTAALFPSNVCLLLPQCCTVTASSCLSLQLNGLLGGTIQRFDQGGVRFTDLHVDNPGVWSMLFISEGILPAIATITIQQVADVVAHVPSDSGARVRLSSLSLLHNPLRLKRARHLHAQQVRM
eukprot:747415-Hanusia_phi.AAC.7